MSECLQSGDLSESLLDERRLQGYRLNRLQQELRTGGAGALLTFDPVNTRYATGMRNMQVWSFHSLIRACFIPASGKAVLFEYAGSEHLADELVTVAEVRPSVPLHFGPGHGTTGGGRGHCGAIAGTPWRADPGLGIQGSTYRDPEGFIRTGSHPDRLQYRPLSG